LIEQLMKQTYFTAIFTSFIQNLARLVQLILNVCAKVMYVRSQKGPAYPLAHWHVTPPPLLSVHKASCSHGLSEHFARPIAKQRVQ